MNRFVHVSCVALAVLFLPGLCFGHGQRGSKADRLCKQYTEDTTPAPVTPGSDGRQLEHPAEKTIDAEQRSLLTPIILRFRCAMQHGLGRIVLS